MNGVYAGIAFGFFSQLLSFFKFLIDFAKDVRNSLRLN